MDISTILLLLLALQSSGLEAAALISAIGFLVGSVATLAKIAWGERGTRLEKSDTEIDYYREKVIPWMEQVIDNQEKITISLSRLTGVVEHVIEDEEQDNRNRPRGEGDVL